MDKVLKTKTVETRMNSAFCGGGGGLSGSTQGFWAFGLKAIWQYGIKAIRKLKSQCWHDFTYPDFIKNLLPYGPMALLPQRLAFTMAEILISLTIIGVIAAITLPALRANINEGVWNTQRKALYSRLSQAISMLPSLNGYGAYSGTWSDDVVTPTEDTAAATFVTDGLAKVLQINNICSIPMGTSTSNARKELSKCGVPEKITTMKDRDTGKTSKIDFPTKLSELNPMFTSTYNSVYSNPQHNIDTNAAAFETKNGETLTVFYNPFCQPDNGETVWHYSQPKMCANFIYDLNGKKGPNKVGKDIGFITALYPIEPNIVAPMPIEKTTSGKQTDASAACKKLDENSRVPNRDELTAMFYNKQLIGISSGGFWSASVLSASSAWTQHFTDGIRYVNARSNSNYVRCVKR